jgi:hypothetical protein
LDGIERVKEVEEEGRRRKEQRKTIQCQLLN